MVTAIARGLSGVLAKLDRLICAVEDPVGPARRLVVLVAPHRRIPIKAVRRKEVQIPLEKVEENLVCVFLLRQLVLRP
jgi:hypothetical protein